MSNPFEPPENPFESLHFVIACSSRDWSKTRDDAWLYGIICGWDDNSIAELAPRWEWSEDDVARLKRLHARYKAAESFCIASGLLTPVMDVVQCGKFTSMTRVDDLCPCGHLVGFHIAGRCTECRELDLLSVQPM